MADPLQPLLELAGVADSVGAARAAVDALLNHRTLRRRSADVSAESALRGAWASAALAGARYELDDVRSGAARALRDPVLQGALRSQAEIASLTETWNRAPRQALARLHVLAAADLLADRSALGRPTAGSAARLDTLTATLTATSAPAVIVAALVQAEILSLDAFAPASGVVARAAARLTLIDRGLDPRSLVVIEVGHREQAGEMIEALAAYRRGDAEGVGQWIRHCAAAVIAGAQESIAICESLGRR
ncbi:MAG: oxidoreductase [Actinobacteria bacterium]|nr:oxidoreductase [Actinomycetota bacterium]